MRTLFNSTATIARLDPVVSDGKMTATYPTVNDIVDPFLGIPGTMKCRIDVFHQRPGKDAPIPIEAGRAPDRTAIMYCSVTPNLKAGDYVTMTDGPYVGSRWLIKTVPDVAQNMKIGHHIEVQIIEIPSALMMNTFPGKEADTD